MNVYIICSVRNATQKLREDLELYTERLEYEGHYVHLPHRDTDQDGDGVSICRQNVAAIEWADEVHVAWEPSSTGSHFDLGAAFVLRKKLVVIHMPSVPEGKSFEQVCMEWPFGKEE